MSVTIHIELNMDDKKMLKSLDCLLRHLCLVPVNIMTTLFKCI